MLRYCTHKEIELEKWNDCLDSSPNSNVYATPWYLDIIHPGWSALVCEKEGSYQWIMPLLFRKKGPFFIHPKPILAQRLGIFTADGAGVNLNEIYPWVRNKFSVFHYPLDHTEEVVQQNFTALHASNFVLPLASSYQQIHAGYRRDRKARLHQALQRNLRIKESQQEKELVQLFQKYVAPHITGGVTPLTYSRMTQLIQYSISNKTGFILHVEDQDHHLLSAAFFIKHKHKLIYVFSATNPAGKAAQANTFLLDHAIREHAGKELVLDFKGSDEPGIADFYRGFGGIQEPFTVIKYESRLFQNYLKIRKLMLS
ncbi:MAG: hypothetical protein MJA30_23035 [Cytophagales bacterium]|nr:hypothetical protein [Cytophagales bacterium]